MSSTLGENIHLLTSPHFHDSAIRPSLLQELRGEAMPGQTAGAGTGSDEPKIPIAVGTIDLMMAIEKEARAELLAWKNFTIAGDLEHTIHAYEHADGDWALWFERITHKWVQQIDSLLHPVKPRKKLMHPCPACGIKLHGDERKPVLTLNCWDADETMMHPSKWDAECEACGATWVGDELTWLRNSLAA